MLPQGRRFFLTVIAGAWLHATAILGGCAQSDPPEAQVRLAEAAQLVDGLSAELRRMSGVVMLRNEIALEQAAHDATRCEACTQMGAVRIQQVGLAVLTTVQHELLTEVFQGLDLTDCELIAEADHEPAARIALETRACVGCGEHRSKIERVLLRVNVTELKA